MAGEEGDFLPLFFARSRGAPSYKWEQGHLFTPARLSHNSRPQTGGIMKRQNGFSLIELLIVVAIILVIAAIAIPNLLRSRMAANEASAAESMRMINTAEAAYNAAFPSQGYSNALTDLGGTSPCGAVTLAAACLLDNVVAFSTAASGKSGYYFTYTPTAGV